MAYTIPPSNDIFLGDSHCHIDPSCSSDQIPTIVDTIANDARLCQPAFFSLMSTNQFDVDLIDEIVNQLHRQRGVDAIVPYFGVHPWYSHLFYSTDDAQESQGEDFKRQHYNHVLNPPPTDSLLEHLPDPIRIEDHLVKLEKLATKYPHSGIGEIGLDKFFRIPANGYFGNQLVSNPPPSPPQPPSTSSTAVPVPAPQSKLTQCRVTIDHQKLIMLKQLELANTLRKPVSLHCVKAPGPLYELVCGGLSKKPGRGYNGGPQFGDIPSVILHSYTGSVEQAQQWIDHFKKRRAESDDKRQRLYFSLSDYINGSDVKQTLLKGLLAAVDDDQILVETDFSIDRFFSEGASVTEDLCHPASEGKTVSKSERDDKSHAAKKKDDYLQNLNRIFDRIVELKGWHHKQDYARRQIFENLKKSIS